MSDIRCGGHKSHCRSNTAAGGTREGKKSQREASTIHTSEKIQIIPGHYTCEFAESSAIHDDVGSRFDSITVLFNKIF